MDEHEELPWPTQADIEAYEEDMRRLADNPPPPPTPDELERMREEWLEHHERHDRRTEITDRYYETLRGLIGK